jgi:hypothetical protein
VICYGRSAILHIGTEKTGTEAIRQLLAGHRHALADLGFWYPLSPGSINHVALAIYSAPENMAGMEADVPTAVRNGRFDENLFAQQLKDEMVDLPSQVHTVIFSNEHCHSRLTEHRHIQKLSDLLSRYFESTTILVYLRRQDEMARSAYSTMLRFGNASFNILPRTLQLAEYDPGFTEVNGPRYFDIEHLLDRYSTVFGKAKVKARLYERSFLENGSLIDDFLRVCGLPSWMSGNASQANGALSADGLAFLALLNEQIDQDPQLSAKIREMCLSIIESNLGGPTLLPSREEAKRFYAQFGTMNERVRALWFPERPSLFSDDFSRYPETVDDTEVTRYRRAMRAALVIIGDLVKKRAEQERLNSAVRPPAIRRFIGVGGWSRAIKNWPRAIWIK